MTDTAQAPIALSDDIERYIRDRLETEVNETIPKIVAKEEERRFGHLKMVVAFVGIVGLGTFGTLSNYLIEKAVDAKVESKTGNMTDALEFIRFNSLSQKLEMGDSFSRQDRAAIMSYLRKSAKNDRVRYSSDFIASLTQVLEAFTRAGQDSSIDEIVQLYEKEILNTDTVVEILLHHYGQQICSRAAAPKDDVAMSVFEKLEAISSGANVPELALVYRSLFLHKKSPEKASPEVLGLLDRAAMLNDSDRARYFREIIERTRTSNWQSGETGEGREFEALTRGFLRVYSKRIASGNADQEALIMNVSSQGIDRSHVANVASGLAETLRVSERL